MLAAIESNIFAALRHHPRRACAATDDRADRCAFAAAGNRADDRADTGRCADLGRVVLRRVLTFDTTLLIDVRVLITNRTDLDQLRVQRCSAVVR